MAGITAFWGFWFRSITHIEHLELGRADHNRYHEEGALFFDWPLVPTIALNIETIERSIFSLVHFSDGIAPLHDCCRNRLGTGPVNLPVSANFTQGALARQLSRWF